MHADLFSLDSAFTPRPAWQVIEAARRQVLTGELTLATTPATHVYLRDGQVYFAERSTDGSLGVRLLVEGIITRQQIGKGALLVSGVEHLGRMFQRDPSIDRQSVELCVELMTDDVLTSIANDVIDHYVMTMYKRHPSGIDRWLPNRVEIITRLLEAAHLAEPEAVVTPGAVPQRRSDAVVSAPESPSPVPDVAAAPPVPTYSATAPQTAPEPAAAAPITAPVPITPPPITAPVPVTIAGPITAPVPVATAGPVPAEPAITAPATPDDQSRVDTPAAPLPAATAVPAAPPAAAPSVAMGSWEPITAEHLLCPPTESFTTEPFTTEPFTTEPFTTEPFTTEPFTTEAFLAEASGEGSGISLAQSAVDAIMSTTIADEVAEAVRRALAAIDAAAQPVPNISAADFTSAADGTPFDRGAATSSA